MNYQWTQSSIGLDWTKLSELYRLAPLGNKPPDLLAEVFENSRYTWFVFDNDELVAAGRALADGHDCAYICDVAVHPNHQGNGIGREMIDRLVEQSRDHKKIILFANPGTEGFYHKSGFAKMRTAMAIFRNQHSAVAAGLLDNTPVISNQER